MARVKLLDKELYELIAAGEVIERPSSIIKELAENSIDSGATAVTIEIKRGGISYMRVTDNGSGIYPEDVHTAFLRHATGKISNRADLTDIHTLGFRGEALASVAAVAKVDMLTKVRDAGYGTHYVIEGTEEKLNESCGCPDGTTIVVRDIFYNVPARLKFLKKDVSEGNDIARIAEKLAVSHPEISVKLIRDNKQVLFTPGDNKLFSAVYSVFGRQFAASLIPVDYSMNNIKITGYTVRPLLGAKNRKLQNFFVNGRYVQSLTCMRAVEEAYKNSIMEGKFPACVLCITMPPADLDVNVHPQKTEVRFTSERAVYETIYFSVKNALLADAKPEEMVIPEHKQDYRRPYYYDGISYEQPKMQDVPVNTGHIGASQLSVSQSSVPQRVTAEEYIRMTGSGQPAKSTSAAKPTASSYQSSAAVSHPMQQKAETPVCAVRENAAEIELSDEIPEEGLPIEQLVPETVKHEFKYIDDSSFVQRADDKAEEKPEEKNVPEPYRFIGEAFGTYIIAQTDENIIFVDKHAAHERINFERMRSGEVSLDCQMLIEPQIIRTEYSRYDAVRENIGKIRELGFALEPLDPPEIKICGIPSVLDSCDASDIVCELIERLENISHDPMPDVLDDMLHSIACKASVRANDKNTPEELSVILDRVMNDERIRYCPHGRPVMFTLKKRELEKQFRRIV